jgi:hypothetical protein
MINNQVPMLLFLKNFRRKICRKYWHLLLKQLLLFAKIDHNFGFLRKNYIFFAEKLEKIAENCDHNIDPRTLLFL